MPDPRKRAPIEVMASAQVLEDAVAQVCADWGVERSEVEVEVWPEGDDAAADQVRVRVTLRRRPDATDADAEGLRTARETLEELLDKMKIKAQVLAHWGEPEEAGEPRPLILDVRGNDLSMLIGRKGETLSALQYLTRLITSKELGEGVNVMVDIEGYRQRREEQLRRVARRMAEQAAQRKRTLSLEPMPPNERRIIHLELRDHPAVRTESVGEGDRRKVTIIPKET